MPDTPTTRQTAGARDRHPNRVAGLGGLTFAAIIAIVYAGLGLMSVPRADAPAGAIARYYAEHTTALTTITGMTPVAVVALVLFVSGASTRFSQRSERAVVWTKVGTTGAAMAGAFFLVGNLFEAVLVANMDALLDRATVTVTLWQLREAAMAMVSVMLGTAAIGLSRAARLSGFSSIWHARLGMLAGCLLVGAAVAVVPLIEGSPIRLLGLAGLAGWLVWLTLTCVRLLRREPEMI